MSEDVHEAVFEFPYANDRTAAVVVESVRPEVGDIDGNRTTAVVERRDGTVVLTVRATDLTALRAGINTWESLIGVAERIVDQ
jgi:KEOPS complex subunit Pcc1